MPLPVQDRAVIFGGGHCTQALVPVLSRIDFRITVIDNRPELSLPKLFPEAEAVLCGDYFHISDYLNLTPSDYVVVMTNGHTHDFDVLRQVLQNPPAYVGVIGSRRKTAFVNQKLLEYGIDKEVLSRVHAPIGTAIKAVTPEEIAVSIAGEMIYERALLREAREIRTAQGCPMH
nr:XdhC family protein [uncultured Schaedlerella sp.]